VELDSLLHLLDSGINGIQRLLILKFKLFICSLFNDAISSSDYIASDDRMKHELQRIWNEAVVA
jgi:hypothetical protein